MKTITEVLFNRKEEKIASISRGLFIVACLAIFIGLSESLAADWPTVIESGVNRYLYREGKILEPKDTWTIAEADSAWVAWIRIPEKSDLEPQFGTGRFYYKYHFISPDGSYDQVFGPYGFDVKGYGICSGQVAALMNTRTALSPKIAYGNWKIVFYIWDKQTNTEIQVKELKVNLLEAK
jgi:hypothetical protein